MTRVSTSAIQRFISTEVEECRLSHRPSRDFVSTSGNSAS